MSSLAVILLRRFLLVLRLVHSELGPTANVGRSLLQYEFEQRHIYRIPGVQIKLI